MLSPYPTCITGSTFPLHNFSRPRCPTTHALQHPHQIHLTSPWPSTPSTTPTAPPPPPTSLTPPPNPYRPPHPNPPTGAVADKAGLPDSVKLMIGAGGIYSAFLYYGSLQEDVFRYTASDGTQFKQAWLLQVLEAAANVIVGGIGMQVTGATKGIPKKMFAVSGFTQVSAKAFTSLALANGLSFPVATLAKSGKMVPVMIGSLLLGGASYTVREYLQVAAIIAGTAIVSMGKKKGAGAPSSTMGVMFILLSLGKTKLHDFAS